MAIGKKVVNKNKGHGRSASHKKQRIIHLVSYIFNPEGKNKKEKVDRKIQLKR